MLPFSIFLFLLFSATLLAPPPPALVGSFKIPTLRSFQWSSLPTSILGPDPQSPPEDTALFPLGMPLVNLEPLPTQCWPNSTLVANNTVPHSFVRATDDRTGCTAVLLVVLLAMLNCFVCFSLAVCLFSLNFGSGILVAGSSVQRISRCRCREKVGAVHGALIVDDHVHDNTHLLSFSSPAIAVPTFQPRSPASRVHAPLHTGSRGHATPFHLG
jgi:hypothetical protein